MHDYSPSVPFGDFKISQSGLGYTITNINKKVSRDLDLSVHKQYNSSYDLTVLDSISSNTVDIPVGSIDISAVYTPNDTSNPLPFGKMSLNGSGLISYGNSSSSIDISGQLQVSRDCSSGVYAGTLNTSVNGINYPTTYQECEVTW